MILVVGRRCCALFLFLFQVRQRAPNHGILPTRTIKQTQVDNPDQRIGEDISTFTKNCIDVVVVFVGAVLKVGSFVGVLLSISPRLTAFVVAYSLAGTLSTTALFGARLKHLIFEGAKREANFRLGVRLRFFHL